MYPSDQEARQQIINTGKKMFQRGFVAANDGNMSVKVADDIIWATPTGVSKGSMTHDMLVKMDLEGNVLEGTWKPSSEVKMHIKIFQEDPNVRAVCHAHPPYSLTFAAAGKPLDEALIQETVMLLGVVPVAPYCLPGTEELANSVRPYVKSYRAVLLEHHGLVTWGPSMEKAWFYMESAETLAKIMLYSRILGDQQLLTESQISDLIDLRPKWNLNREQGGRPRGRPDPQ